MKQELLPSWREGVARSAVIDFVRRVTDESAEDFVPTAERVAVFDNDGTLWCEYPMQTQFFFAEWRLKTLIKRDPDLGKIQPFKAFLEHDKETLRTFGKKQLFEMALKTHSGTTEDEFDAIARGFFEVAKHPLLNRPFNQLTYRPQIELLEYLSENEFRVFIVSGGGIDLIRAFAEQAYGIPRERVIGSSVKTRFEGSGSFVDLMKLPELNSFDDREVKVQNIGLHIGRRPILVFGNSDGDLAMMRYAMAGKGARLALLVHHDDADREFTYDREFRFSPLREGLDDVGKYGITLVSMKKDWERVFDQERSK